MDVEKEDEADEEEKKLEGEEDEDKKDEREAFKKNLKGSLEVQQLCRPVCGWTLSNTRQ